MLNSVLKSNLNTILQSIYGSASSDTPLVIPFDLRSNGAGSADYYDFTETVEDGKVKGVPFKLPQGEVIKFTGSAVQVMSYY